MDDMMIGDYMQNNELMLPKMLMLGTWLNYVVIHIDGFTTYWLGLLQRALGRRGYEIGRASTRSLTL